jgi:hypothetical protein
MFDVGSVMFPCIPFMFPSCSSMTLHVRMNFSQLSFLSACLVSFPYGEGPAVKKFIRQSFFFFEISIRASGLFLKTLFSYLADLLKQFFAYLSDFRKTYSRIWPIL